MYGCLLALLDGNVRFEGAMNRLKAWALPVGAGAFLSLIHPLLESNFRGAYTLPFGISLESALIAFVIAWFLRNALSAGANILNSRFMVHIGVLSYSLYLWQQPFLTNLNTTFMGIFPIELIFAYGAACASYYLIEKRFLNLRRQFR
jgi:peptidoglycan/LPS O-acetylase OafA/YrhL